MAAPAFTVLLPVTRPPDFMVHAIRSVLNQSRPDFELFVVSDGASPATAAMAKRFAARDSRVRVFEFPKGERHGEAHRHVALGHAKGQMLCQIADDDLWFPEHLSQIALLLKDFEFGNTLQTSPAGDGNRTPADDLGDPAIQQRMLTGPFNIFGPTVAGYRMETYRRLPIGWSPAPPDVWTDLAMWRKFLALPRIVAGTRFVISSLHFPTPERLDWTVEQRQQEMKRCAELICSPEGREQIRANALQIKIEEQVQPEVQESSAVEPEAKSTPGLRERIVARLGALAGRHRTGPDNPG